MPYGVTSSGFVRKTQEVIKEEIEDKEKSDISPTLNVSSASVIGQLNGIFSAKVAEVWELAEAVYGLQYPGSAIGAGLDGVADITGTIREAATKSTVVATVTLTAGTTLPAGSVAHVSGDPTKRFVTLEEVENSSGITDDFDVDMEAEETGPVVANSGTLTVIATPVVGWTEVTNDEDATPGADIETDAAFRVRRADELAAQGGCTVDSIRADLLAVDGVTEASVFENVTMVTDADGVPAKAIECVVLGGTNADVAEQVWSSKPAGIQTHGGVTVVVQDDLSRDQTVKFSRPTTRNIHLEVDLTKDPDLYPADGDDQVEAAIVALEGSVIKTGVNVIIARLVAACFSVAGVVDVTEIRAGFSASPVGTTNLTITSRELADFDTSRILVDATDMTEP